MQYNTNQWIVFNYLPGAGGKFLMNCFFQYDKIAHWLPDVVTKADRVARYLETLPSKKNHWGENEMDSPWGLSFYSRTFPRGNDLTESQVDLLLDNPQLTEFHTQWNSGKYITDIWHKGMCPAWWTNANHFNIIVDDWDLYKRMLFSKNYRYEPEYKRITCLPRMPGYGGDIHQQHTEKFQNQSVWENVSSVDEFFEEHIVPLHWYQSWNFNDTPKNGILLTEMFDTDKIYQFMSKYNDMFDDTIPYDNIKALHYEWKRKTLDNI